MKEGYKKTEMGVIPNEWQVKTIGELFEFKNGLNKEKEFFGKGTKIINYVDVFKNRALDNNIIQGLVEVTEKEKQLFNTKKGDVFFTRTSETVDEIGMTSVLLENINDLVYSGFVLRARPKTEELDLFYKKYCFSEFYTRKQIMRKSSCTTRALTSGTLLKDVLIKIPTKKEQQKIAEILSTVDSQIDNTDKLIEKTKELRKGLMQRLLNKGIGHTEFKKVEFGQIPSKWEVEKIGNVFGDLKTGATPSRTKPEYFKGSIPWITSGELKSKFICKTNEFITDMAVKDTNLRIYPKGTFFIAITGLEAAGTRGSCGINAVDATTNQSCLAFQEKNGLLSEFLYYWYMLYGNYIGIKYTQGTKQQSLNNKIVEELEIGIPTVEEQKEIVDILSSVDVQIEENENKKEKLQQLKKALMQQLLTGKIRVI